MRILYVVTGASYGGAVRHVLDLCQEAVGEGYEAAILAAPESRLVAECKIRGLTFVPNPYFTDGFSPVQDLLSFVMTLRVVRRFDPDLIAAHTTKAGLVARGAALLLGYPVVFTAHGWAFAERRCVGFQWIVRVIERMAAGVTQHVICVSEQDCELARAAGISPATAVTAIHNGIPVHHYATGLNRPRRERGVREKPVGIMVARMAPPKDYDTLLRAMSDVLNVKLLLVGDGPWAGSVRVQVCNLNLSDRVEILGECWDVLSLLREADFFVLSSTKEGLPYAVLEAMACGLPVVATGVGGLPEIVHHGVHGFLVPPKDPKRLARALCDMAESPDLRAAMGFAARERVLTHFTLERMARRTFDVYQSVLRKEIRKAWNGRVVPGTLREKCARIRSGSIRQEHHPDCLEQDAQVQKQ